MMKLQPYSPAFEKDCLSIFDSNVPAFFAPREREIFRGFLNQALEQAGFQVQRQDVFGGFTNQVRRQQPDGGTMAPPGSLVVLYVV